MQLSNLKSVIIGVATAAAVIAITGAASGSGIGAVFNLGTANTVNATSRLKGSTKHPMLAVTNNGTGTALSLQVAKGKAPFTVNSSTRVTGLNASLLGGFAADQFVQGGGQARSFGFTMSTATDATKILLSVPGFGTLNAHCRPDGGGTAYVTFTTGTHTLDDLGTSIADKSDSSVGSSFLDANTNWLLTQISVGAESGIWQHLVLRYSAGLLGITHIATHPD